MKADRNFRDQPSNGSPSVDVKLSIGGEQDSSENDAPCRTDKNRLHALKHGILSRNLLEALVARGESLREWRNLIRELRVALHVEDALARIFFDRLCAALMREALSSIAEREIFVATDESPGFEARVKRASMPAQLTNGTVGGQQALDLLRHLSPLERYGSRYRKEFDQNLGALLALRDGGPKALAQFLNKATKQRKDHSEDTND